MPPKPMGRGRGGPARGGPARAGGPARNPAAAAWTRLQRKIFSRWVKQKLFRHPEVKVTDVVVDMKDGFLLTRLLQALSEEPVPFKMPKKPSTMRIQQIELVSNALKWCWALGVKSSVKPSAEDLCDGKEKPILGLVWAIMLKFIKIGDEDEGEQLNAQEALLMWVQNKISGYTKPSIEVNSFGKDFHSGVALCLLIHKHRPKMIPDVEELNPADKNANILKAFDAAEAYFGLEKYITPEEFLKLDDKCMMVYVSEYYYGIAEQRKIDLAARRISKIIKLTKENDRLKKEYQKIAAEFKVSVTKVEKVLEDVLIDNTMAGAKRRIEEFYQYKADDKNVILGNKLSLEALFNNLAMRLTQHKRPEFVPPEGVTLKDVDKAVTHLEECEQIRNVALHAELNRQVKLVQLDDQHKDVCEKLWIWIREKEEYLNTKEICDSISTAQLQLALLDAYDEEAKSIHETNVGGLVKRGEYLGSEKYERIEEVKKREADIEAKFPELADLSSKKRPVLEDDLAREIFREKVRLMVEEHVDKFSKLEKWVNHEAMVYLNAREVIDSVSESRMQSSLLVAFGEEKAAISESQVAELKKLGQEILDAKYETQYSSYVYPQPEDITAIHESIDSYWVELSGLEAKKKVVLDDHMAREEYAAQSRMKAQEHIDKFEQLNKWIVAKEEYLNTREEIHSVAEATTHLSLLANFDKDMAMNKDVRVGNLKALGAEIMDRKYETGFGSYVYDHTIYTEPQYDEDKPELRAAIGEREAKVDEKWELLADLSAKKKAILQDHFDREHYASRTRLLDQQHQNDFGKIEAWVEQKEAYLNAQPEVHSVAEAETQLSLLENYEAEKGKMTSGSVAELKTLGGEIEGRKYETEFSFYEFEHTRYSEPPFEEDKPELRAAIGERHNAVDAKWDNLEELAAKKKSTLEDHLAREKYADETRLLAQQHAEKTAEIMAWTVLTEEDLKIKPQMNSVIEAQTGILLHGMAKADIQDRINTTVAQLKELGAEILARKYETEMSTYELEHTKYSFPPFEEDKPADRTVVTEREGGVDAKFNELVELAEAKQKVLDDHLEREKFKEGVALMAKQHAKQYATLISWVAAKEEYLNARETIECIADAQTQIALLESYNREKVATTESSLAALKKRGEDIKAKKYETEYSYYVFEHTKYEVFENEEPEKRTELDTRVQQLDGDWGKLTSLAGDKDKYLQDALALEQEKENLRLEYTNQVAKFGRFCKDATENSEVTQFGFTLEEVQEFKAPLNEMDADLNSKADVQISEIRGIDGKMTEKGVKENVYCKETLADVDGMKDKLNEALAKRMERYETELALQIRNDNLCKEWAAVAEPFSSYISESKEVITKAKDELEKQLQFVEGRLNDRSETDSKSVVLKEKWAAIEAAEITNVRHTNLTLKDCEVNADGFYKFLDAKKEMLQHEIEHMKLRGVTPEQYAEIQDNFSKFDADNSGSIDKKELTACLYSLGEERSSKEVKKVLEQHGDGKVIPYEGFKEFMIGVLGDTDTKEEVIEGFLLINKGNPYMTKEWMGMVMDDEDVGFIWSTAPAEGEGQSYTAWVEEVFSR